MQQGASMAAANYYCTVANVLLLSIVSAAHGAHGAKKGLQLPCERIACAYCGRFARRLLDQCAGLCERCGYVDADAAAANATADGGDANGNATTQAAPPTMAERSRLTPIYPTAAPGGLDGTKRTLPPYVYNPVEEETAEQSATAAYFGPELERTIADALAEEAAAKGNGTDSGATDAVDESALPPAWKAPRNGTGEAVGVELDGPPFVDAGQDDAWGPVWMVFGAMFNGE